MAVRKSIWIWLAAMLIGVLIIAGCGGGQGGTRLESSPTPPATAEAGTPAVNAGGQTEESPVLRTVAHAMGETDIEGTPERVVTLFQAATDAALQLGVKPVGAVEAWIEKPWYNYIRDRMEGVTNLGSENQPNLEEIIALKPDIIIASKSRHEKIYEQLSAIAPTVMDEEVYFWKDTLKLTAEALNKQEEEQVFVTEWERKVAEFKQKAGDRLDNVEAAVVDFRADHVRIVYTGFAALVLDELGIKRPENQKGEEWGVKLTSKENIPQMNADLIFDQTSLDRDDGRVDVRDEWMQHPLWKNLRAVQGGKVYEVDTATWNNGSGPIAASRMLDDLYRYFEIE